MSVNLIADVLVTGDSWLPEYAAIIHDIATTHGDSCVSRSGNISTLAGKSPDATLVVLIKLSANDAVEASTDDPNARCSERRVRRALPAACAPSTIPTWRARSRCARGQVTTAILAIRENIK